MIEFMKRLRLVIFWFALILCFIILSALASKGSSHSDNYGIVFIIIAIIAVILYILLFTNAIFKTAKTSATVVPKASKSLFSVMLNTISYPFNCFFKFIKWLLIGKK